MRLVLTMGNRALLDVEVLLFQKLRPAVDDTDVFVHTGADVERAEDFEPDTYVQTFGFTGSALTGDAAAEPEHHLRRAGLGHNPTAGLWSKRNSSSGHFTAIKRGGDVFKGVRREN